MVRACLQWKRCSSQMVEIVLGGGLSDHNQIQGNSTIKVEDIRGISKHGCLNDLTIEHPQP